MKPIFNDDEPSCAASFLWWQQPVSGQQSLWDLVRSCTANIKREGEELGGLAFWARMLASKTLPELATSPVPPYTPPYTVMPCIDLHDTEGFVGVLWACVQLAVCQVLIKAFPRPDRTLLDLPSYVTHCRGQEIVASCQDYIQDECLAVLQITSSSVGINPIAAENGPIKILRTHMMLSTFGITSATEAGTMTHAHTFGKR